MIFGLSVSSSWGNGHATLWRGLVRALSALGHDVTFFERDFPFYARHRDLHELPGARLILYQSWDELPRERLHGDVAIITSYCPDADRASELPCALRVFYDLDTPVTLERLDRGERVEYLPPDGLGRFDLVLSYTGGSALEALRRRLGARSVAPLYGSVDPEVHRPAPSGDPITASYLGTYSADRQEALEMLLLQPARSLAAKRFLVGGPKYPPSIDWPANVRRVEHVAPGEHPAFYGSSRLTLSVTRAPMAASGWCPSGRLFEAAACGTPVLSDDWPGLDQFFVPDEEILIARNTDEAMSALTLDSGELERIAGNARARALSSHTAAQRAKELLALLQNGGTDAGHHSGRRAG